MSEETPKPMAPPAVTALREAAASERPLGPRVPMERSVSQDIREERQDLKEAAEHSLNVLMDLDLDGKVRWVSMSWEEVIGTSPDTAKGKPISEILVENKTAFTDAVDSMKKDDSRSHIIRFTMEMGPASVLRQELKSPTSPKTVGPQASEAYEETQYLNLEAQGIMVYDLTTGNESHTMWMIRPSVVREVTIDLPGILVESLGIGAEMLAHYLTGLAEAGPTNSGAHAPPLPVLCRICERQITPWWFEKHTELCLQEHKAEMDVQMAQESLSEHRNAIVRVLDALENSHRQATSTTADGSASLSTVPEYKGLPIQPSSTPSSGTASGRASPASPPSRSQDRTTGFGHHRARSFAVRRPIARIVELVLDLCDTAVEINTPAIKDNRGISNELRTQSPQSENRISQVLQWQSPNTGSLEQGLALLCEDTSKLARAKVDNVYRHRRILEYSERIRCEFDVLVQECIEAAMHKAAKIAAGEDSESSEEFSSQADEEEDEGNQSESISAVPEENVPDGGIFPGSFDAPSSMAQALRNASDALAANPERRAPSTTASTRSSSPHGSQTPRSHAGTMSFVSQNKRASMQFESDAGADSDTSVRSSAKSAARRADSPGSELSLSRVASSRERKRKSLVLPSVMSSRQQSPARSMGPPSSPLRTKPRIPSGAEPFHSPITSPVLSTSDFSSPAIAPQHSHHHHHHRRQSSAAGSDILRPLSPRMMPTSNPQPRAVAPSIRDFEIIKPISKGAFGSVYLAKKKSTGDYFAIKVLKKNDMVAKNQVTNVKAERAIMMWQGESDFVAKLYWTFSSKDFLYLVMEYLNGGDCASLIKVLGALPEDWAKKYLAEVVLGVEHLHSRNIVHRDLKPDNLLIDQKGHLKLTDFGLSRMGLIGRQKNALNRKSDEASVPDLLKQGPFQRAKSVGSSRSASFDFQGNNNASPSATPSLTPALTGDIGQPSYFSLNRDSSNSRESRRKSGNRSDSGDADVLQAMFRRFSLAEEQHSQRKSPIEEENPSEGSGSPDPYSLHPTLSQSSAAQNMTPPQMSAMLPPPTTLFDPEDKNRRFVGTPDYLAPETIAGDGQGEVSDWWSLGCILFESLYGYPPFHADTPEDVFQNILDRKIDWPDEESDMVSDEAKDLMNRLMCVDPNKRLGANADEKYSCGGEEIRKHPWFSDINWETLREDEASFVPAPENPEDTEYFDARGATLTSFAPEFEDQQSSSNANTPGADYPDRPHDALSRIRSQVNVNTMKRGLIPLHIPPHVREGRGRRLSEPMAQDDFGSFNYKNLPVLEKANKDVIQKLRAEAMQAQSKPPSTLTSPGVGSPTPSLESSPMLPMPLKRAISTSKSGQGSNRPASPSVSQTNSSPSRVSQPSSPLLVQFSTGQNHERRKTSSGSSSLSHQQPSLQPGSFFDQPRLPPGLKTSSSMSSPVKIAKTPGALPGLHTEKTFPGQRHSSGSGSSMTSPRARSQTVGSQESEASKDSLPSHHKRRSQVLDVSPSSSDNEDQRAKALLRVQRRRQSSRRLSQINITDGPFFRPLDVLVCEDHPVSRLVMEKLLEKLRCRTITVQDGSEAVRYAMSEVKFDIIMMEFKLPQINGADVARMIRDTKNANCHTPIVAVTGYLKELQAPHHFDALIEKPPTIANLTEVLGRLCQWKPPPPNWTPTAYSALAPSSLRMESTRMGDSPTSNISSFPQMPSGSYRGSSREDSISSSFFGDAESGNDVPVIISRQATDDWRDRDLSSALGGLGITEEAIVTSDLKLPPPTTQETPITHQNSAPAVLQHPTPKKQRSSEHITKRRAQESRRNEAADMGDDEDEELGDAQVRAKSPRSRPKASSKLGTEMMRTNSHGSVISVEEIKDSVDIPSSLPPSITEEISPLEMTKSSKQQISLTPPEIFPPLPGDNVQIIDMDATPKAPQTDPLDASPSPTPRASSLNPNVDNLAKSSGSPSERK